MVLMVGEPGSGKTGLGTQLARELRIPFVARDDVRTGLYFTAGAWGDRPGPPPPGDEATETFLRLVETLAGLGVSELLLCGMMTQNCVTHTALSKGAEKYTVSVLADCCTTVSQILHLIALNALSTRVALPKADAAL